MFHDVSKNGVANLSPTDSASPSTIQAPSFVSSERYSCQGGVLNAESVRALQVFLASNECSNIITGNIIHANLGQYFA